MFISTQKTQLFLNTQGIKTIFTQRSIQQGSVQL